MAEKVWQAPIELSAVRDVDRLINPGLTSIDFSATTATRPAAMVGLLAVLEWQNRQRDGQTLALILPPSQGVRDCWQVSGLTDALREFCQIGRAHV